MKSRFILKYVESEKTHKWQVFEEGRDAPYKYTSFTKAIVNTFLRIKRENSNLHYLKVVYLFIEEVL